ncbi:MAG TPA: hypothetical protein P5287_08050, partial [bacterium]|nr:hypothetical protein [bacterium]
NALRERVEEEKLFLMCIGAPYVETLGRAATVDGISMWSEEFMAGSILGDHVAANSTSPERIFRYFWRRTVRKHSEIQFMVYARSLRLLSNDDPNPGNSIWSENSARVNDIGNKMAAPDPGMMIYRLWDDSMKLAGHYPVLRKQTRITDICDGLLDALGEKNGLETLRRRITGGKPSSLPAERWQAIVNDISAYISHAPLSYMPPALRGIPSRDEAELYRLRPRTVMNATIFVRRRLYELTQSPWIWSYIQMKGSMITGMSAPVRAACRELHRRIREDWSSPKPLFAKEKEALKLAKEIADAHGLTGDDARYVAAGASYAQAVATICEVQLSFMVAGAGIPADEYTEEIKLISSLIAKIATNPAQAPQTLHRLKSDGRVTDMFARIHKTFDTAGIDNFSMIIPLLELFDNQRIIPHSKVVAFLKEIPMEDLIKVSQYEYIEVFRDLLQQAPDRFASLLNRLNKQGLTVGIPKIGHYLFGEEQKSTTNYKAYILKTAFILNAIDTPLLRDIFLLTTDSRFLEEKLMVSAEQQNKSLTDLQPVLPQAIDLIDCLASRIDFNKAISLGCLLLENLRNSDAPLLTAGQIRELPTPDKRLDNHLLLLMAAIRPNIMLNVFRQLALRDPAIITAFLDKLDAAGYAAQAKRMRQILAIDSRLSAIPAIKGDSLGPRPIDPREAAGTDLSA